MPHVFSGNPLKVIVSRDERSAGNGRRLQGVSIRCTPARVEIPVMSNTSKKQREWFERYQIARALIEKGAKR